MASLGGPSPEALSRGHFVGLMGRRVSPEAGPAEFVSDCVADVADHPRHLVQGVDVRRRAGAEFDALQGLCALLAQERRWLMRACPEVISGIRAAAAPAQGKAGLDAADAPVPATWTLALSTSVMLELVGSKPLSQFPGIESLASLPSQVDVSPQPVSSPA